MNQQRTSCPAKHLHNMMGCDLPEAPCRPQDMATMLVTLCLWGSSKLASSWGAMVNNPLSRSMKSVCWLSVLDSFKAMQQSCFCFLLLKRASCCSGDRHSNWDKSSPTTADGMSQTFGGTVPQDSTQDNNPTQWREESERTTWSRQWCPNTLCWETTIANRMLWLLWEHETSFLSSPLNCRLFDDIKRGSKKVSFQLVWKHIFQKESVYYYFKNLKMSLEPPGSQSTSL